MDYIRGECTLEREDGLQMIYSENFFKCYYLDGTIYNIELNEAVIDNVFDYGELDFLILGLGTYNY